MPRRSIHPRGLDVEVLHVESIVLDELAAGFNVFAHQSGEDGLGFGDVFELDRKQRAPFGIHGGLPQLRGGHFAQALVALYLVVLFALFHDVGEELAGGLLFNRFARDAGGTAGLLGLRLCFDGGFAFFKFSAFGVIGGRFCCTLYGELDEEGRLEKFLDLRVLGHHLAELGAGGESPVDAARGALRVRETEGPCVVFLVLNGLAEIELELVCYLGKLSMEEAKFLWYLVLGLGSKVRAVHELGAGQQFCELLVADTPVNFFDEAQVLVEIAHETGEVGALDTAGALAVADDEALGGALYHDLYELAFVLDVLLETALLDFEERRLRNIDVVALDEF